MVATLGSQLNIYIQWWHIPKVGVCLLMMKCNNEQDPAVSDLLPYWLCPNSSISAYIPVIILLGHILQHPLLSQHTLSIPSNQTVVKDTKVLVL